MLTRAGLIASKVLVRRFSPLSVFRACIGDMQLCCQMRVNHYFTKIIVGLSREQMDVIINF